MWEREIPHKGEGKQACSVVYHRVSKYNVKDNTMLLHYSRLALLPNEKTPASINKGGFIILLVSPGIELFIKRIVAIIS